MARNLGLRRVVRHAYAGLVDIRLKQGKGEEAVLYLRRYYEVRDSLLNTAKIRQIVELEARHELELKEKNIRILENEKRIQTLWTRFLIISLIFLVAAAVGLYQWIQYRHKKNHELLNLEIDYLMKRQKEVEDKYKATFTPDSGILPDSQDQRLLKQAISVVEAHFANPEFGVETMAFEMNMSRTNLHRKLKTITGLPPSELIRSIRLRKAAQMILNGVDTVSQIALMSGFEDYSHFSKSFKKHFGVAPTAYAEHNKN